METHLQNGKNKTVNKWDNWYQLLAKRNEDRLKEIIKQGSILTDYINPIKLCIKINSNFDNVI